MYEKKVNRMCRYCRMRSEFVVKISDSGEIKNMRCSNCGRNSVLRTIPRIEEIEELRADIRKLEDRYRGSGRSNL